LFVAIFSFPRTVLSLKQSTEPKQVQLLETPKEVHLKTYRSVWWERQEAKVEQLFATREPLDKLQQ
jgi:hypothetical protein